MKDLNKTKKNKITEKIGLKEFIGEELLFSIQNSYLNYLESSASIYEVNGDYAVALFSSHWCDFLNQASRKLTGKVSEEKALKSGKWICHEDCLATSLKSIKGKKPCSMICSGGIEIFATPIIADGMVIGSNNAGVSNPPTDKKKVEAIAERYKVDSKELLKIGNEYISRPEYVLKAAKSHISEAAETIATIFLRKLAEEKLKAINQKFVASVHQQKAANQQLKASEQQLKAANQQLKASEQQLKAANQQLEASNQQLIASEQSIRKSERELTIRNKIAEVFLTVADEQMYDEVLKIVLEVMESEYCIFGYIDEEGAIVVPSMTEQVWDQCQVMDRSKAIHKETWGDINWPRTQAIMEKRTILSNECSVRTPEGHISITRHISLPIIHRGEVVGLIQVANKKTDYNEQDIELFETIGKTIAPILAARIQRNREEKERRRAEETLRHYEHIVSTTSDMLALLDNKFSFIAANQAYLEAFKLTAEELIGHTVSEVFGEKFFEELIKPHAERCLAGQEVNYQAWFDFPAYQPRYMDINYYPYRGVDKKIKGYVVNGRNITDRKKIENELENIFILSPDMVAVCTIEGKFLKVNPAWEKVIGYTQKELLDLGWTKLVHPDDVEKTEKEVAKQLKGSSVVNFINRYKCKDGSYKTFEWQASFAEDGIVHATARDITDRKKAEERIKNQNVLLEKAVHDKQKEMEVLMERLLRQEKLATIGQISGSIAHELRNPLSVIKQSIYFLNQLREKNKLESLTSKMKKHFEIVLGEIDISNKVISDLLQLTKMEPLKKKHTDLRAVILELLDRYPLEKNTQLKINLKPEPFLIWADPIQMRQVLLNILSNATYEITNKRVVTISAEMLKKSKKCLMKIHDDGPGITDENLSKVFEPLYTSKVKGIGLGLNICKQIIENHGGSISLTSEIGKGTTVKIELPYETLSENC